MTDRLHSDLASLRIDHDEPRAPSSLRRLVVPILVILALGAGGVFAYQRAAKSIFKQEVRTTEIAMISPSQADVQVTATGYVIPQVISKVGSKYVGRIAKINVKEGDTIKQGDVIAQLEDSDQRSQLFAASSRVGAAQSRIAAARANLAEISQQVERERQLVNSGAAGKANFDNLVARETALREAVKTAEAETTVAQADLAPIGLTVRDRLIVAPIGGRIVTKPATIGEVVGNYANESSIAEIVDFNSLMVEVDVPEPRLHLVKIGGPCEAILDAYPNKRYGCIAEQLGNKVNRTKGTVMVKVRFDAKEDLAGVLPEMSARVSFLSRAISEATKNEKPKKIVATSAIADRNGGKVVYTVVDGKLHEMAVKVGAPAGAGAIELLDGPPQGVKVVANPTNDTADGQGIKETEK